MKCAYSKPELTCENESYYYYFMEIGESKSVIPRCKDHRIFAVPNTNRIGMNLQEISHEEYMTFRLLDL